MRWTLFDYGVGNIHSLHKAMAVQGEVRVTRDPASLQGAEAIVLPGVGALGAVMASLEPARAALEEHHASGRPLVGVCIGMQALHAGSEEDDVAGLGFIGRRVQRLPASAGKVPHMGWNTLAVGPQPAGTDTHDTLGRALAAAGRVYYVHSYAAPPGPETVAVTEYGMPFSAAVRLGNTVGFQFHPEKSSRGGLHILHAAMSSLEDQWKEIA